MSNPGNGGYVMSPEQLAERARAHTARVDRQPPRPPQTRELDDRASFHEQRQAERDTGQPSSPIEGGIYPMSPEMQRSQGERYAPQTETAPAAIAAATGHPVGKTVEVMLEVPVRCSDGILRTSVIMGRPKWAKFEEYASHALVTNKRLSSNSAMIAACAGVPIDFMLEVDMFDAVNLANAMQDFFPQALRDKLQALSPTS